MTSLAELNAALAETSPVTILLDDRVVIPAIVQMSVAWYSLTGDPDWPVLCVCEDVPVAKFASVRVAALWEVDCESVVEGVDWLAM